MQNSRLFSLVSTLNNKEIRDLSLFLASPFFNKREEVSILFDFLSTCLHDRKMIPDKKAAFQKIAGKQVTYDDQQMRLWMSFLLKAIEKYLVHNTLFEDKINTKLKLVEIYRARNLTKYQERSLIELEKSQDKSLYNNAKYYADDFQIQSEQYRLLSSKRRMSELNLQKMLDNLDIAYLSQKLRQACLAIAHQTVYKTKYAFGLLEPLTKYIETKDLTKVPAIAIYYYIFQTLTRPEESTHFKNFKETVVAHGEKFPAEELGDIYILAINFCIRKYNEGEQQFLQDEFELYKNGLTKNLFMKNGILSRFTYRNIVTVALVLKEFSWVEIFISDYKNKLDKNYQETMYSFNLARLEYSRKNFKEALQLLQKSSYKDLLLNLAAKTVMLKIFFEEDEFDLLESHLEAMRIFIRRKKIIGYHQENYIKLIQFTKKLIDCNPFDRKEKTNLQTEIQNTKSVAEKGWLLEQCVML